MSFGDIINQLHNENSFTNTSKYRVPTMSFGDIINQLHNENSFTNTSPSKKTNLSTLSIRCQQIYNFDASDKNFLLDAHLLKCRGFSVNSLPLISWNRSPLINRITNNIDNPS